MAYDPLAPYLPLKSILTTDHIAHLDAGIQGAEAAAGASIDGTVATVTDLDTVTAASGDLYLVEEDGYGYLFNGFDWDKTVPFRGPIGPPGPGNTLSVGTVTTGAAGSAAEASVTGTSPSQSLNLTIPQGLKGDKGDKGLDGVNAVENDTAVAGYVSSTTAATGAAVQSRVESYAVALTDPRLPGAQESVYAHAWADADGRVALGVRSDGSVEIEGQTAAELAGGTAPRVSPLVLTLSGGGGVSGEDTRSSLHVRYPFSPTVDVTVKAVHIRNYNDRSSLAYTGALSFNGVWVGPHKVDHTGLTGQFTSAPTQVSGAFTTGAGGEEYVISGLNIPLGKNTEHLLSFGYTCAAGQVNHKGVGGAWTTASTSDATVLAPASMTRETLAPLDVWLEVEHTAPIVAWVGDSIACGVGNQTPVYTAPGTLHARANGVVPMLYCHSGSQMVSWTGGSTLWKYAKWATMTRPDVVVWQVGRNDLIDSPDVATMRTRFNNLYPRVADYMSPNIYMTTVTPKADDETSTDGTVRRAWNDVIRNELQGGAAIMAFDVAKATERAGGTNMAAELNSGDNLHFNRRGSSVIAQTINQPLA